MGEDSNKEVPLEHTGNTRRQRGKSKERQNDNTKVCVQSSGSEADQSQKVTYFDAIYTRERLGHRLGMVRNGPPRVVDVTPSYSAPAERTAASDDAKDDAGPTSKVTENSRSQQHPRVGSLLIA